MYISAQYANAGKSAVIAMTDDRGAVALSSVDTPAAWAEMLAAVTPAAYVAPNPVPETISDRQFFQALALQGTITQAEALAAVKTGTVPAALQSAISNLTGNDAFNAEMLLSGATQFNRSHPLTATIGAAQGMSPSQIDAFFQFAAGL